MRFQRRQIIALVLLGVVLLSAGAPLAGAAASFALSIVNPLPTSGTAPLQTNSGATIHLEGSGDIASGNRFPSDNSVALNTSSGNATFTATGPTDATVTYSNITGTWTKVSELDVSTNALTIDPEDKRAITVSGDTDRIEFRDATLSDGNADLVYAGASGTTTVTVSGVKANTQIRAIDADTNDVLDIAISTSGGDVSLTMPNSEHTVLLQEGAANPVLTNPTPDGNVSTAPSTFKINVSDNDFPSDTVNLTWYFDGSQFDTTTGVTSDGQQSVTAPSISPGVHTWSVVAEDELGNTDVANATVGVPGTLYLRNETNASELVDSPVNVTVRFFNGTVITEVTTDTGTVDMTGLATTDFIVEANASQDYYQRVVYKESIIGDDSIYMLNTSVPAVETRFVLEDPTGEYPPESVLIVKKPINRSGTVKYRTVYSDEFGVEGVTADLEKGERYEISIRNPDGDVQQVGPYRADVTESVTVRPGSPTIELGEYQDGWSTAAELDNRTLEVSYSDPSGTTQQLTVFIHERDNKSNQLRANSTYYDLGNFTAQYTLTANESDDEWVVKYVIEKDDGSSFIAQEPVANRPNLVPNLSKEWRLIAAVVVLLISSGVFSMLNAKVGGVVVAIEGGLLWYTGWLEGATTGAAVVLALFVAVLVHIMSIRP